MRGGGLDCSWPARPNAFQLTLGPVDASRADAGGERGIVGDQQDEAAPLARARQGKAGREAARAAEMAPDDAEAARQTLHDGKQVRRADGIGDEEGAGQGAAIAA